MPICTVRTPRSRRMVIGDIVANLNPLVRFREKH